MAKPGASQNGGGGKLPPIPTSAPGERPYYSMLYHKLGQTTIDGDEFLRVVNQLTKASNMNTVNGGFSRLEGAGRNHWFGHNEKMQKTILGTPLSQLQRAETWEARTKTHREFSAQVLPYAEEAVKAGFRIFRGRAPVPSTLEPFCEGAGRVQMAVLKEAPDSFIVPHEGLFIHVWTSHADARRFIQGFKTLTQRLQELRIDTVTVPYSELIMIQTVSVTITPLVPINDLGPLDPVTAPALIQQMDQLDCYCRSRIPLRAHAGADGRYYVMNPTGALLLTGEPNGERSNIARTELFDHAPEVGNTPMVLDDTIVKAVDKATEALKETLNEMGEEADGVLNLKIQNLVMDGVAGRILRKHGVGMGSMYHVLQSKHAEGPGVEAVLRETIVSEMVCRTMKEIFRAEIQLTPFVPDASQSYANASNFVVELLNRCLYNLMVRPELWDSHFLDVLRSKFRTPDSYVIPQNTVTKRLIIAYLTTRLGVSFEGGKFSKIATIGVSNTLPKPCETLKMILEGGRVEAHEAILSRWKKIQDIRNPQLKLCSMLHQTVLLACARSSSLEWHASALRLQAEEFDEPALEMVINNILVECVGELPETNKFKKAVEDYQKPLDEMDNLDFVFAMERNRSLSVQQYALFRGREKDTFNHFLTQGCNMALREGLKGYNADLMGRDFKPKTGLYLSTSADSAANHIQTVTKNSTRTVPKVEVTQGTDEEEEKAMRGMKQVFSDKTSQIISCLLTDHNVTMLCSVLMHYYPDPDGYEKCLDIIKILRSCMTTGARIEQISAALQSFVAACLTLPYTPTEKCLEGLYKLAEMNSALHEQFFTDEDQRFQVAILMTASHWGRVPDVTREMQDKERAAYSKFEDGSMKINNTQAGEQRALLAGEWYIAMTGPACETMMSQGQWSMAQHIIKFGQLALKKEPEGKRKSTTGANEDGGGPVSTACELSEKGAHPQLHKATKDLFIAIRACEKLQRHFRHREERAEQRRLEEEARAEEIRAEKERRRLKCETTMTIGGRILPMAKQLVETKGPCPNAMSIGMTPKVNGVYGETPYKLHHGLRALCSVMEDKQCSNCCGALMQSGIFPSIKWTLNPAGRGFRSLCIIPTTDALGMWWNSHWLQLCETGHPSPKSVLFAKVAANYIFAQYRYTHLNFVINGQGFAGMIAQYLATLIPHEQIEGLITIGSPPAFYWPKLTKEERKPKKEDPYAKFLHKDEPKEPPAEKKPQFPLIPNTHITYESDLATRLIGNQRTRMGHRRLVSRLEGLGAVLPFPFVKELEDISDLGHLNEMIYIGPHHHEISCEKGEAEDGSEDFYKYNDWQLAKTKYDVRHQMGYTSEIYLTLIARAAGKMVDVRARAYDQPFTGAEDQLWSESIDRFGEATVGDLEERIFIPPTVEEICCTPEKMILAYPKLADTISKEMASIPETYAVESMPDHSDLIADLEKARDPEEFAEYLSAYLGCSWDAEWIARQMFEWSGSGHLLHLDKKITRQKKRAKANSVTLAPDMNPDLVRWWVAIHSVFFVAAPFTTKHGDKNLPPREGTPTYMDGVKEKERKLMQLADGYHMGWQIAIASVTRGVGKSQLAELLALELLNDPPYTHAHKRTEPSLQQPTIRMRWTPKPDINGVKGYPIFLQVHYQEIRYDGKTPCKTLIRTAAQVVWVVVDSYTFQRTMKEADLGQRAFHVFVYIPKNRSKPDPAVVQELKQFCLARSFPFAIVEFDRPESVESLQKLLFAWMVPSFHFPINPMQLPPAVEVGALHTKDDEAVEAYVARVVEPGRFARDPILTSVTAQRKAVAEALDPVLNTKALEQMENEQKQQQERGESRGTNEGSEAGTAGGTATGGTSADPLKGIHQKAEDKKQQKKGDGPERGAAVKGSRK